LWIRGLREWATGQPTTPATLAAPVIMGGFPRRVTSPVGMSVPVAGCAAVLGAVKATPSGNACGVALTAPARGG
jgi:hypothetical protein